MVDLFKQFSPLSRLCEKLKENDVVFNQIDKENAVVVARALAENTGLDVPTYLFSTLMEKDGLWAIVIQAVALNIGGVGIYSEKNALTLLEGARGIYERHHPHLDEAGNLEIKWEIAQGEYYTTESGQRYGLVEGTAPVGRVTVTELYELLEQVGQLPQIDFVNASLTESH